MFTAADLGALAAVVGEAWLAAADRDWSVPAGTLEWSCLATADHAVDCVYAPAFFLASGRTDAYPTAGGDLRMGDGATPATLVESLHIAVRILTAVVATADPQAEAVLFGRIEPKVGRPPDFLPRAATELALHAHDVCTGLALPFAPPPGAMERLRDHTRDWQMWSLLDGPALGATDDPWTDMLRASGR
jgi:hypothetical protein